MSLDIQSLLAEISTENPCGEDLEYDADFGEMERAAQPRPAPEFGDANAAPKEPDWPTVKRKAMELFTRTKDLRVAFYLTHSLIHVDGLPGLRDGLALIRGLLEQYWDTLHPQLDPDDKDPTERINTLTQLSDPMTTLQSIRDAALVDAKGFGRFSLRDNLVAQGRLSLPAGSDAQPVESSTINGAFMAAELDDLKKTADAIRESIESVSTIEAVLMEKVGAMQMADLSALPALLKEAQQIMAEYLTQRGVSDAQTPGEGAEGVQGVLGSQPVAQPMTGTINSREDVVLILDKVCDYFKQHEPSSPVPLLLQRAKRLVAKDFMEILRDLTPSGVAQAEEIGGILDKK